jgi:phosphoribosyl-AMP cyclohydrolase
MKCGGFVDIVDIQFNNGLLPAIVQEYKSGKVLMLAYMNEESLKKTMETGTTWFFSRSRNRFWKKGESSGHFQYVKSISIDCDGDTILLQVEQIGVACHTGNESCFYREIWNAKAVK